MTLQDLMMLYGVTLGKRRTAKQKYLFAQQLNESLPPLGWPVRVQQREGRFSKIENLIAGDLANAKVVIAVPFDTPAKALRPQNTIRSIRTKMFSSGGETLHCNACWNCSVSERPA